MAYLAYCTAVQHLFTTDGGVHITYELVRDIAVVFPGQLLTNRRLHQTGQRRQDIDWWVDLPVVQLTVNKDLALGDVTSKIGNGVSDICAGSSDWS